MHRSWCRTFQRRVPGTGYVPSFNRILPRHAPMNGIAVRVSRCRPAKLCSYVGRAGHEIYRMTVGRGSEPRTYLCLTRARHRRRQPQARWTLESLTARCSQCYRMWGVSIQGAFKPFSHEGRTSWCNNAVLTRVGDRANSGLISNWRKHRKCYGACMFPYGPSVDGMPAYVLCGMR